MQLLILYDNGTEAAQWELVRRFDPPNEKNTHAEELFYPLDVEETDTLNYVLQAIDEGR